MQRVHALPNKQSSILSNVVILLSGVSQGFTVLYLRNTNSTLLANANLTPAPSQPLAVFITCHPLYLLLKRPMTNLNQS